MDYKAIIRTCREMGCCDACCVRYCALRKPTIFGDFRKFIDENTDSDAKDAPAAPKDPEPDAKDAPAAPKDPEPEPDADEVEAEGTPAKRKKTSEVCVSCLGILQEDGWPECLAMTKEVMDNKKYETDTFACALSAPLATMIREKAVVLKLTEMFPSFENGTVTPLKEAWKWSLGPRLAAHLGRALDSGAFAPLMITLNMEYADDNQEAEVFAPSAEQLQRRQRRQRHAARVTRCLLERALDGTSLERLAARCGWRGRAPPRARGGARCVSVEACHAPLLLGGRYIKLSRELSQSPWVLRGERMMESSVQEIIFQPIADLYGLSAEEAEHRLKFLSAGREDVDVRCLGEGRPFAIEVADPRRALSAAELQRACALISRGGKVLVHSLLPITKDKLVELKKGEESKLKTYEALCIKLSHTEEDIRDGATEATAVRVQPRDMTRVRGEGGGEGGRPALVRQLTPLRVLHRRALLLRERSLQLLSADIVPGVGREALFTVRVQTEAGTYVKEWAHGELGRTRPALRHALGARTDILALDVTQVLLDWP